MTERTLEKKVVITNPMGFHMRPVAAFATLARQFQSDVYLRREDQRVNGKSPLDLLLLAAEQGTELTLEVSGPDAATALPALVELLTNYAADPDPEPPLPTKRH